MHKLTFTLKQHTPIIHFQHDQDGATLRASEVKPKLDRFIYNKWLDEQSGNKENVFKKYGRFTVGFDEDKLKKEVEKFNKLEQEKKDLYLENFRWALNYKLSFTAINNRKIEIQFRPTNAPMYFGNMGNENEDKHFRIAESVTGDIKTQSEQLKLIIEKNLPEFFFTHNFGTRQSKGYGSFTIKEIDSKNVDFGFKTKYSFNIETDNWKIAMTHLGLFYQSLRSGINIGVPRYIEAQGYNSNAIKLQYMKTDFYMKPIIFLYAKNLDQQWDKKTIKQTYFNKNFYYRKATKREQQNFNNGRFGLMETLGLPEQQKDFEDSDALYFSKTKENEQQHYYDFRDLFGLSSDEEWYSYGAKIKKENAEVERFKSPITFKPVLENGRFCVFIILSAIEDKYKGTTFTIKSIEHTNTQSNLTLQIPKENSLNGLFEFIANEINIDDFIDDDFKEYSKEGIMYYQALSNIYNQLQNNKI